MSTQATSTQVLSGAFKHGAGRIILLAVGGTVVAAALVTAVAVRQSSGGTSPSDVSAQINSPLYPASREGIRGHVDVDSSLATASDSARSTTGPLYPASREGIRGHVDVDSSLATASDRAQSTSSSPNYPASRYSERTVHTTYIVASPEQAAAVRTGILDANTIRLAVGEPLLLDSVLVVGSDAEAEAARAGITDSNRILVGLGEPEELVVDLRTR